MLLFSMSRGSSHNSAIRRDARSSGTVGLMLAVQNGMYVAKIAEARTGVARVTICTLCPVQVPDRKHRATNARSRLLLRRVCEEAHRIRNRVDRRCRHGPPEGGRRT